jgi:hypothetical protein
LFQRLGSEYRQAKLLPPKKKKKKKKLIFHVRRARWRAEDF